MKYLYILFFYLLEAIRCKYRYKSILKFTLGDPKSTIKIDFDWVIIEFDDSSDLQLKCRKYNKDCFVVCGKFYTFDTLVEIAKDYVDIILKIHVKKFYIYLKNQSHQNSDDLRLYKVLKNLIKNSIHSEDLVYKVRQNKELSNRFSDFTRKVFGFFNQKPIYKIYL